MPVATNAHEPDRLINVWICATPSAVNTKLLIEVERAHPCSIHRSIAGFSSFVKDKCPSPAIDSRYLAIRRSSSVVLSIAHERIAAQKVGVHCL
jgi:hypothetical protein